MVRPFAKPLILVLCFVAALPVLIGASAPTVRPEEVGLSSERLGRITELMQRHIDAQTFAGSVTLVARNGRIAHFEARGLMDLESRRPMQKDAVFRIMSMTKPVVACAILMMIEGGKVRLTDPVSKFIPELQELAVVVPNTAGVVADAPSGAVTAPSPARTITADRQVTIRDLLTHTSGLMSGGASSAHVRDMAIGRGETLAQVLPRLQKVPLDFQPGTRWAYSGQFGFDVLARVVEVASGVPFDVFLKQRIFGPLGMKDTFFYPSEGHPRLATLYRRVDGLLRKQPDAPFVNGAYFSGGGGLFSTAEDYLQFAMMLLNGGQLEGTRLVGRRVVELMTSVFVADTLPGRLRGEGYGLGVRVVSDAAARNTLLSKGSFGWSGAYNTHFFIEPNEKIVGIFMTQVANLETRGEIRNDFETAVMQAVVDSPVVGDTN
jgi:CubicO group peptidase (beta-lactamase class C family)